jgi:hypothetical protein
VGRLVTRYCSALVGRLVARYCSALVGRLVARYCSPFVGRLVARYCSAGLVIAIHKSFCHGVQRMNEINEYPKIIKALFVNFQIRCTQLPLDKSYLDK